MPGLVVHRQDLAPGRSVVVAASFDSTPQPVGNCGLLAVIIHPTIHNLCKWLICMRLKGE